MELGGKLVGSCLLLALREHAAAQEALCLLLEWKIIQSEDQRVQIATTLQSTPTGSAHYAALCSRQLHLKELVRLLTVYILLLIQLHAFFRLQNPAPANLMCFIFHLRFRTVATMMSSGFVRARRFILLAVLSQGFFLLPFFDL